MYLFKDVFNSIDIYLIYKLFGLKIIFRKFLIILFLSICLFLSVFFVMLYLINFVGYLNYIGNLILGKLNLFV